MYRKAHLKKCASNSYFEQKFVLQVKPLNMAPNSSQIYGLLLPMGKSKGQFYCFSSLSDQAMHCLYLTGFTFNPLLLKQHVILQFS
jgi:hypothetical protein